MFVVLKQRFQVAKGGVEASYPGEGRLSGEFFGDLNIRLQNVPTGARVS